MLRPVDASRQAACARNAVLAVPAEELATLVITGSDRVAWLNGLVTCDLTTLTAGTAIYGLAVEKKGHILADLVVVARLSDLVVAAPREAIDGLRTGFEHHLVMEDAELCADGPLVWRVIGPKAREIELAEPATVTPFDWAQLGGAIVLGPAGSATGEALRACVRKAGGDVGDPEAWEALRIEQGVPRYGVDFDQTTFPQEASLDKRAVSFKKGCYLGQEVVCMLELRGHVRRKLVRLALDAGAPRGAELRDKGGAEVGRLTSIARGSSGDAWAGLAMVKLSCAVPGTELMAGGARARVR